VPDSTDREALDRVVTMLGLRLDEARSLLDDVTSRWRGDALRVGEGSKRRLQDVARELGLVTRADRTPAAPARRRQPAVTAATVRLTERGWAALQ
jgi:polyhydroxyalkanoate synthesis regulator phasin